MPLAVLDPASSTCCKQQWENKKRGFSFFFFLKLRLNTANLATNQDYRVCCVEIIFKLNQLTNLALCIDLN